MKILTIINNMEIGGAQKLVADLLAQYVHEGYDQLGLLAVQDKESQLPLDFLTDLGIKVYELKSKKEFSLSTLRRIRKIAKDYDVVHVNLFPSVYLAALATKGLAKKLVYTEHNTHNRRRDHAWLRPIEKYIYGHFKSIIAISPQTKDALSKWLKSDKISNRIVTVSNGINVRNYAEATGNPNKFLGRDGRPILMISRFSRAKDQATLVRSIPLLQSDDAFVVFAGDGETRGDVEKLAADLGVADRCIFLGSVQEIPALIKSSHIGVQSSHWEGFGLTAVEMMAGGLPVVASDVPGLHDVVEGAGYIFKTGDYKSLANILNELLLDDIDYEEAKIKCQKRAEEYDVNLTAKKYLRVFNG